jgi:hypothetical protein
MDRPLKETVYTPDSEFLNFGALLRNMGRDLLAVQSRISSPAELKFFQAE